MLSTHAGATTTHTGQFWFAWLSFLFSFFVSYFSFLSIPFPILFPSFLDPATLRFLTLFFCFISALLVFSTIYLFVKVSLSPDIFRCGWLGLKHQLTNCALGCWPKQGGHSSSFFLPRSAICDVLIGWSCSGDWQPGIVYCYPVRAQSQMYAFAFTAR